MKRKTERPNLAIGLAMVPLLLVAACSDGDGDVTAPGPPAPIERACTPEPALVVAQGACVQTDQCPCGTSCALGRCFAACTADSDCGGEQRCSRFGQCRAAEDINAPPLATWTGTGQLGVDAEGLVFGPMDGQRTVGIRAAEGDLDRARVAAGDGLEVSCGGALGADCFFEEGVAAGQSVEAVVRPTRPLVAGEVRELRVFANGQRVSLSVTSAASALAAPGGPGAAQGTQLAGIYRGQAVLQAEGLDTLRRGSARVLPLSARVYEGMGSATLVLDEPTGLLAGQPTWIGTLSGPEGGRSVNLPVIPVYAGEASAGSPFALLLEASTSAVTELTDGPARTLSWTLSTTSRSVAGVEHQQRWTLSLYRSEDLPTGSTAPAVPADAGFEQTATRLSIERQLEGFLRSWVGRPNLFFGQGDDTLVGLDLRPETEANAVACALPEDADLTSAVWHYALAGPDLRLGPIDTRDPDGRQELEALLDVEFPATEFQTSPSASALWDLFGPELLSEQPFAIALVDRDILSDEMQVKMRLDTSDRSLPCAFELPADAEIVYEFTGVQGGSGVRPCGSSLFPASHRLTQDTAIDMCAEMEARYGCTVEAVNETVDLDLEVLAPLSRGFSTSAYVCSYEINQTYALEVSRTCRLSPAPAKAIAADRCGEVGLCFDPASTQPNGARGFSATLDATIDPASGDLSCAGGEGGAFLPLDEADALAPEMLQTCLQELESWYGGGSEPMSLGEALAPSACLNPRRLVFAAGMALENSRQRRSEPGRALRGGEERLGLRLLQRWLQVHTFLARQSAQAEQLAQILREDGSNDPLLPPAPDSVLQTSLRGWALLRHPRFGYAIGGLSGEALALPDYRSDVAPSFQDITTGRSQGEGLVVAMLETASAQLDLLRILMERAHRAGDRTVVETAYATLRGAAYAESTARELYTRAKAWADAQSLSVPWEESYQLGLAQLVAQVDGTRADIVQLLSDRNPLGIEDADLPLYFSASRDDASRRFSAISDFLLGESPSSPNNFTPSSIRTAREALGEARSAWLGFKDRRIRRAQSAAELDARLEEIHLRFAGELTGYCGTPGNLDTVEVLDNWTSAHGRAFSANDCFHDFSRPQCDFRLSGWAQQLDAQDVLFQYCVAERIESRLGVGAATTDRRNRAVLDNLAACAANGLFPVMCDDGEESCLDCGPGLSFAMNPSLLQEMGVNTPSSLKAEAESACAAQFPTAQREVPGLESTSAPALEDPRCYRGSLGAAVLNVRSVANDLDIARSELTEFEERYDIAMRSCIILKAGNDQQENAVSAHNQTMTGLRAAKFAADTVANIAGGVKDCADSIGPEDALGGATAKVACVSGAVETTAEIASDALQLAMDQVQQDHDALMMQLGNEVAEDRCFNDTEMELVGARTAALRVQRAMSDLQLAVFDVDTLKILAATAYNDGLRSLQAARDRAVMPLEHDLWLDERVERFTRRMRVARRLSYLAVRAVEYEYQQSLRARAEVLAAELPDQLEQALDELWATAGTRRINGNAPAELKVVLSLKNNILQLADQGESGPGYANLSDTERLRLLLSDPRYDVYEDGTFVGRRIPFRLAPLEQLGLSGPQGISIFAANSCAERLWSVNATLQGDAEKLFVGDNPAFVNVDLQKSNTFFSQWCSAQASDFQEASVRPNRNLFADPAVSDASSLTDGTDAFSTARMQAFFNVDRQAFSDDSFANGESAELAGRGLFGEYAIFFPAAVLRQGGGNGLELSAVEDVLLRLDYVSVAR